MHIGIMYVSWHVLWHTQHDTDLSPIALHRTTPHTSPTAVLRNAMQPATTSSLCNGIRRYPYDSVHV